MNQKQVTLYLLCISLAIITSCNQANKTEINMAVQNPRTEILFDFNWRFHRGEIKGAEKPEFNDETWRTLDLPHDYSIEDLAGKNLPFDSIMEGGIRVGYMPGGTAWYRKSFEIPEKLKNKKIKVIFEGIYMNADIWLNGIHLGNHPYGYTEFFYDITEHLKYGETNVLAIQVKNEGRNSRWYSGSGIYRHVWLSVTDRVYFTKWGSFISTLNSDPDESEIKLSTAIANELSLSSEIKLTTSIINPAKQEIMKGIQKLTIEAGRDTMISQSYKIPSPLLWSPDTPDLYQIILKITGEESGQVIDSLSIPFGIRSIEFSTEGFFLNGKNTLLKGANVHHDHGPLGAASFDRAEERKVKILKEAGFNAVRTAHNPPSTAFLDACDRYGLMVMDEIFDVWKVAKVPQDYHLFFNDWWKKDLESMILRDRNHPSIIMWSTGNEIPETAETEGVKTSAMLAEYVRSLDSTRPVTAGVHMIHPDKDPYFATLDIAGYNYGAKSYKTDTERIPDRIIVGTESGFQQIFDYWMGVVENPNVIGDFCWTGWDYLGEAGIGWLGYPVLDNFFPWHHAYCADIDICGFKTPQFYYRDVIWNERPVVHILVKPPVPSFNLDNPDKESWSGRWDMPDLLRDWTWMDHKGKNFEIEIYSTEESVELFLNEKSLGKKTNGTQNKFITRWTVPYEPGKLKAIAFDDGKKTATDSLITAGEVAQIIIQADRPSLDPDGQDLCYLTLEFADDQGTLNPKFNQPVLFEIEGPATIQAVGNSNPVAVESFRQPFRNAWRGRCLVILRSTRESGLIKFSAETDGLGKKEIHIKSKDINSEMSNNELNSQMIKK
jgi:beta-galactosidase